MDAVMKREMHRDRLVRLADLDRNAVGADRRLLARGARRTIRLRHGNDRH